MQVIEGPVRAAFESVLDPDYRRLCGPAQSAVTDAVEAGTLDGDRPFEVRVEDGVPVPAQLPDLDGSLGSVGEVNAVLSTGLPEIYSQPDELDPIYTEHLAVHWGG